MTSAPKGGARRTGLGLRGRTIDTRELRLWSGLALGLFLLMHFGNLGLGLVSVAAMEAAEGWLMGPWRTGPGTALLYGSLALHFGLTLRVLYRRRTMRMSGREAAQFGLGLLLPLLLAGHVVETRIVPALSGHAPNFGDVVKALLLRAPANGLVQIIALFVAWGHVSIGIWFWLRAKPWFPSASGSLLAIALLVPILALLGFAEAGKELASAPVPGPPPLPALGLLPGPLIVPGLQALLATIVGAVLAARAIRRWAGRHHTIRISFPKDRLVTVPAGSSVLEASRMAGIAHASACGGRGRCSTCRVRVLEGIAQQPPPSTLEAATLKRFTADRDVRLACQLRPTHDLAVLPIFPASKTSLDAVRGGSPPVASHERDLAILFCDLRGFTRRAEQWLPFDTVYILNRYFETVGHAVENAGGHLDKFIGDGALALFGLDVASDIACGQAIDAATAIARALTILNRQMRSELAEPLRIAMGLHTGPAVVGEMGYGQAISLTAIGDGINVASRLEGAAKEFDVEAMISRDLAIKAGLDVRLYPQQRITVRGRVAPVDAIMLERVSLLARTKARAAPAAEA